MKNTILIDKCLSLKGLNHDERDQLCDSVEKYIHALKTTATVEELRAARKIERQLRKFYTEKCQQGKLIAV